jgi:peptide/nickel transport system ATP-binding protein
MENLDSGQEILTVEDLQITFETRRGLVYAVNGIGFQIRKNEVFGLVGESGCGKTVTALSLTKLLPNNAEYSGSVKFRDSDIFALRPKELNRLRRNRIATIFQDPFAYLNPVLKVGDQMKEVAREEDEVDEKEQIEKTLRSVGLPNASQVMNFYPNQLSGGMSQRVMIAMALIRKPELIVADEITTALDVTIQAQILNLLNQIRQEYGLAILFITHDLGLVAQLCDKVAVMYAGTIVEQSDVRTLFENPLHPYTKGLFNAVPKIGSKEIISGIPGSVSVPVAKINNCPFNSRCGFVFKKCYDERPLLSEVESGHSVACYLYEDTNKNKEG